MTKLEVTRVTKSFIFFNIGLVVNIRRSKKPVSKPEKCYSCVFNESLKPQCSQAREAINDKNHEVSCSGSSIYYTLRYMADLEFAVSSLISKTTCNIDTCIKYDTCSRSILEEGECMAKTLLRLMTKCDEAGSELGINIINSINKGLDNDNR